MVNTDTDVRSVEAPHGDCRAVADILMCIGDKWTIMVVGVLSQGPMRYTQIHRKVDGVSQRMLTLTLRALERDGLVDRTVFPTIPPKVEYTLTTRGESLVGPVVALWAWAKANRLAIEDSRHRYDAVQE